MIGMFAQESEAGCLMAGEVGFVVAGIKDIKGAPVGDTLISAAHHETPALRAFRASSRRYMPVFSRSIRMTMRTLRRAGQLTLNDASLFYEPELMPWVSVFDAAFRHVAHGNHSGASEQEYNLNLITTAPTVIYEIITKNQGTVYVDNPQAA